jgi:hypothetical protein
VVASWGEAVRGLLVASFARSLVSLWLTTSISRLWHWCVAASGVAASLYSTPWGEWWWWWMWWKNTNLLELVGAIQKTWGCCINANLVWMRYLVLVVVIDDDRKIGYWYHGSICHKTCG